ncbi:MAG: carbohydrate ABC transporter permease [Candidatus Ornithospirochaeta sp.]
MTRRKSLYVMCLPAILLIVFFVFIPLVSGIRMSLTNWDGFSQNYSYVGFENYRKLFTDKRISTSIKNTFCVGICDTLLQNVLGLLLALLLNRKFKGNGVIRAAVYMPVMVSSLLMGYIWYFIVQYSHGALNDILKLFGAEPVDWLAKGSRALVFITVITSLQFVGQAMVIYLAGLQGIPKTMYEAPQIDGANSFQIFFKITLPMLRPSIMTTVVLKLIGGLQMYDLVVALTGGGPGFSTHTISTMINYLYFDAQNAGYSAALGVFLFIVIMTLTLFVNKVLKKED